MSIWARLIDLVATSPFTGTWMSPATALLTLIALLVARRLLPHDDRHHGRTLVVFVLVGLVVGIVRLGLYAVGAQATTFGVLAGIITTFCVAVGAIGTAIIVFLVVLPGRLRVRVPFILRDSLQAVSFVIIAFAALSQSGINVASLITTAGVLTAVIGLALQNTIANVFAGLMLNMDRELDELDWVQVGTRTGQIVQIRWRSTILRTIDGDIALVPNSQMLSGEVYNFSRPSLRHRVWHQLTFDRRHAPNQVRELLVEAARGTPGVLADPAPDAIVVDLAQAGVVYALRFWIESIPRKGEIVGEVLGRVWYAARRAGIEIPFATSVMRTIDEVAERGADAARERAERRAAVDKVDLFAPLSADERERLADGMKRVTFARGEHILRQGDPGDSLYIVVTGQVRVGLGDTGDAVVGVDPVATLGPGDFFGETSLLTGAPRSATCSAITDVVAYIVDRAIAREVLAARPAVAEEMSTILAARQADLARRGGERAAAGRSPEHRRRLLTLIREFFELK